MVIVASARARTRDSWRPRTRIMRVVRRPFDGHFYLRCRSRGVRAFSPVPFPSTNSRDRLLLCDPGVEHFVWQSAPWKYVHFSPCVLSIAGSGSQNGALARRRLTLRIAIPQTRNPECVC